MNRDEQIESNVYYHVYNRGNDRDRIFGDESDYAAFIEKMKSLAVKYSVEVPVYTLMVNHYHLIARQHVEDHLQQKGNQSEGDLPQGESKIVPAVEGHHPQKENRDDGDLQLGLSRMMGALATSAAKRYNLKYAHIGHLFQGPYRYKLIPDDALWTVACYIHLNPVRAGLAKKPEDWAFSNYAECVKQKEPEMNVAFNKGTPETKATFYLYQDFVEEVLKHEQAEKEYRKKIQEHVNGFFG